MKSMHKGVVCAALVLSGHYALGMWTRVLHRKAVGMLFIRPRTIEVMQRPRSSVCCGRVGMVAWGGFSVAFWGIYFQSFQEKERYSISYCRSSGLGARSDDELSMADFVVTNKNGFTYPLHQLIKDDISVALKKGVVVCNGPFKWTFRCEVRRLLKVYTQVVQQLLAVTTSHDLERRTPFLDIYQRAFPRCREQKPIIQRGEMPGPRGQEGGLELQFLHYLWKCAVKKK